MTHFDRLGLPQSFALDRAEIERQYLARSRAVHPDFFQDGGDIEQRASLDASSALNEAYGVLRDPFRRAEYLMQIEGGPGALEMRQMPAAFLEAMLELRMEIDEVRERPDSSEFAVMETQLDDRRTVLVKQIADEFERIESPEAKKAIRQLLNAGKYVQGLLRDLHAE